jgi:hypothetical protein
LCEKLETKGRLAANFFFKRGNASRGNATRLFATIAYQLAAGLPELDSIILENLLHDPAIVNRSFSVQLEKLIIQPCRHANLVSPPIIIIDGLDECEGRDIQEEILRCFANSSLEDPLPVYLLVASRPEPNIAETFEEPLLNGQHRALNVDQSFEDVRTYLLGEFARIYANHRRTMAAAPSPWPSPEIIDHLVRKSSGYFVYASTIIKFVDDKDYRPSERLDIITGLTESTSGSPFAALDQLYSQILCAAPHRPQLLQILAIVVANFQFEIRHIEQLLELRPGDVRLTLRGLHSVISFDKRSDDDRMVRIIPHHASFLDYLQDSTRAGPFYVCNPLQRTDLALRILKALSYPIDDPDLNAEGAPIAS